VLAHFATRDKSTPPDVANALVKQIRDAGKQVEAYFYEADHAFFNDQRPTVYNADAAKLAWTRTVDFLRKALSEAK
jgi:carboxymethylenebutenolidase